MATKAEETPQSEASGAEEVEFPEEASTPHEEQERDVAGELSADELPADLREAASQLTEALEIEVPGKFPEDNKYPPARQPEAIGQVLIDVLHPHLEDAELWWIYRQSLNRNKSPIPGRTQRSGAMVKARSGYDYTLNVNYTLWSRAGGAERIRVVDELLSYCTQDDDGSYGYRTPQVITHLDPLGRWGVRDESALQQAVHQLGLDI